MGKKGERVGDSGEERERVGDSTCSLYAPSVKAVSVRTMALLLSNRLPGYTSS